MASAFERKQAAFRKKQFSIRDKNKGKMAYILKGGYYYRSNYRGYTEVTLQAGVYDINEACDHVVGCSYGDYITIVPIDAVKHNAAIIKEIKALTSKLI